MSAHPSTAVSPSALGLQDSYRRAIGNVKLTFSRVSFPTTTMVKWSSIMLGAAACGASAHTKEEITRKGAEVMEEYRKDRGHWVSLSDIGMVNHMVDHIGANGMAVAGFFIHQERYSSELPGEAEQDKDPLFVAYRKLAKDQVRAVPGRVTLRYSC